jgi:hypothetical protein
MGEKGTMTQYQPYPGQYPPQQQLPPMRNGLGTAALVLGIVGAILALIPIIGIVGFICGLVGVGVGIAGFSRASKGRANNRTTAIIGTILSVVAVIISIVIWTSFANAVGETLGPDAVRPAAPGQAPAQSGGEPQTQSEFEAGQAADIEGLVITAGPLQKVRQQFGDPVVCSDVNYVNNSHENRGFNGGFDWKLQDPNNVIANPTIAMVDGTLSAGELAPGGKVAGKVCFTDPKLTGEYAIINEELVSLSSTPVRWKTAL